MDFIFMLTRHDSTIEDAGDLIDAVCDLGVTHIGFKDVGVPPATMRELVEKIKRRDALSYLEVVSTAHDAMLRSLEVASDLGVDCVLGGTDLDAALRILATFPATSPFPATRSAIRRGWKDRPHWSPIIAAKRGRWAAAASIFLRIGPHMPTRSTWCGQRARHCTEES